MGRTYSKPTVIRTQHAGGRGVDGGVRLGPGPTSATWATRVYAVDVSTGALLWRFDLNDTNTYISTDITAAETDDEAGTRSTAIIDRVFFADSKGRIWKLDPGPTRPTAPSRRSARRSTSGWASWRCSPPGSPPARWARTGPSPARSPPPPTPPTGWCSTSAPAAPRRRPRTCRTRSTPSTPTPARSAPSSTAATGLAVGIKFYGGVVFNNGQLVFTQGQDLSGLGLCAASAGIVVAIDANTFELQFETVATSKIVAPMYAQQGEIYTVTITGQLMASQFVGTPPAGAAAGAVAADRAAGAGAAGRRAGAAARADAPFMVMGWRQL